MDEASLHPERPAQAVPEPWSGMGGKRNLATTKTLVVGAGALGCALLQQLAVAGVGCVGIADGGKVQYDGAARPVLFGSNDEGELKVKAAAAAIHRQNQEVAIKEYPFFIYNVLALKIIPKYDLIFDCTDHLPTRLLLNDACALLGRPMIFGALHEIEGIVGLLHVGGTDGSSGFNYRDVAASFPSKQEVHEKANPEMLSVLAGIIGCFQARAFFQWVNNNRLSRDRAVNVFNMQTTTGQHVPVQQLAVNDAPKNENDFLRTNYEWLCSGGEVQELSMRELQQKMQSNLRFVDVREAHEAPDLPVPHQRIPLSRLREERVQVEGDEVIVVCHMGVRSVEAVRLLSQWAHPGQKLYSLKGGILALAAVIERRAH